MKASAQSYRPLQAPGEAPPSGSVGAPSPGVPGPWGRTVCRERPGRLKYQGLDRSSGVTRRLARAMLGQAVTLRDVTGELVHGIVTSVLAEGDGPRVVVAGCDYSLAQILTVAPPDLVALRTPA